MPVESRLFGYADEVAAFVAMMDIVVAQSDLVKAHFLPFYWLKNTWVHKVHK